MRKRTAFFMAVGLSVAMAVSANAALYEYLEIPNNVAFLGTPYAELVVPGELEGDPDIVYSNYPLAVTDTAISVGEPGTADFSDRAHYASWPGLGVEGTRLDGIYSLQVNWDTAYDLTMLNAYVSSGDTVGTGGAIDADRIVSNVDFYVSYEPVGSTPVYSLVGSMAPGATDDVGGFDLTTVSGTWNGVTSVRYDFTQPVVNPAQCPRIAEVQAIAPGVTVNYPGPLELSGLTLVGEGGFDNIDNLASGATAFSTPVLDDPDSPYSGNWSAANVNDGIYMSTDWLGLAASPTLGKGFVGLNLGATPQEIGMVAFSENNISGGVGQRCWGEYEVQYTTVANPDENTPDASWTTIGTAAYNRAVRAGETGYDDFQDPGKRHIFSFDSVMATGVRLVVPETWDENNFENSAFPNVGYSDSATAIDELEVYAPGKVFDPSTIPSAEGIAYTADGVTIVSEGGTQTAANLALASNGGVVFSSGTLGDENGWTNHNNAGANNGVYGNGSSWIGSTTDYANYNPTDGGQPFIGVALTGSIEVGSIAIGRNNSEILDYYLDRWAGEYILQYTNVENPDADTPDTNWTDIGTVTYLLNLEELGMTDLENAEFYAAYKRHLIEFDPVTATALRILVPSTGWNGVCIDEFEVYAANLVIVPGDANYDGKVDAADAAVLASNWLATGASWSMGDFNEDGVVDDIDATLLATNWQTAATAGSSVPEPGSIAMLLAGLLSLAFSFRSRRIA